MTIYERALELIPDGATIGLGSGRASHAFVRALGQQVQAGSRRVRGVPTSESTASLARELGIPLVSLGEVEELAVTVDGADEVDPGLNLIKGYGRALVREKIVAASSARLIILVGSEKLVDQLGSRGKLPVEVVPFALPLVERRIRALGYEPVPFHQDGQPFRTDNGNCILDCQVGPLSNPAEVEQSLRAIPGVVGTGLFLGMADRVLIGNPDDGFRMIDEKTKS